MCIDYFSDFRNTSQSLNRALEKAMAPSQASPLPEIRDGGTQWLQSMGL